MTDAPVTIGTQAQRSGSKPSTSDTSPILARDPRSCDFVADDASTSKDEKIQSTNGHISLFSKPVFGTAPKSSAADVSPGSQPGRQPQASRRASSFAYMQSPLDQSSLFSVGVICLALLIHLGILVVLGLLLHELQKTTADFRFSSNNATGAYFRVALYGGGLGASNKPFYVEPINVTTTTITAVGQ